MQIVVVLLLLAIAILEANAWPPLPVEIESLSTNELYLLALKENRTLRVAWGGDAQASGNDIKQHFESRFPGVKLDLRLDLSKYLEAEIDTHYENSDGLEESVDVAVLQSLQSFSHWKTEGRLLPYKVSVSQDIYPQFVDADGAFTGLYIFSFGSTVYNPRIYQNVSVIPTAYPEFLAPQFKHKIVLTYPNDDEAILFLFSLIVQKYGWGFMESLLEQEVAWVRGTATPSQLLGATNDTSPKPLSISFASSSAFASGVTSIMSQDVYMAWPQTGAIFARSQAPEAAKLFLNYLLDDEWQGIVGGPSIQFATRKSFDRLGVFSQKNMNPLEYGQFVSNRTAVEEWKGRFESMLGPPQGPNPNCATSQETYGACSSCKV